MRDWLNDVKEFHKKFGVVINEMPTIVHDSIADLRHRLIEEEFDELMDAMENEDLVGIADAVADMVYVLLGLCVTYGIDINPIFDEVHRSNMEKTGGKIREDGKVLKPKDWTPPDIKSELKKQGMA